MFIPQPSKKSTTPWRSLLSLLEEAGALSCLPFSSDFSSPSSSAPALIGVSVPELVRR